MKRLLIVLPMIVPVNVLADASIDLGVEQFRWREKGFGVTEDGQRLSLGAGWQQEGHRGLGYAGRVYSGAVDYSGQTWDRQPLQTHSDYLGWRHEIRWFYRPEAAPGGFALEPILAVGYEGWMRKIRAAGAAVGVREDYEVAFVRAGVTATRSGWSLAGGIKQPWWARESSHLKNAGFSNDVTFSLRGRTTLYAEIACRLTPHWRLAAGYDGYRFKQSDSKTTIAGNTVFTLIQPATVADTVTVRAEYRF